MKRPRLDSKIQSDAAEFLVLGHLLLENIPAFKAYNNQPGYDLVAASPEYGTSARIQVKSRWATDAGSVNVSRFDFDFLVLARLNRGRRYTKNSKVKVMPPDYYILSKSEVDEVATKNRTRKIMWNSERLKPHIYKCQKIAQFLKQGRNLRKGKANV